MDAIQSPTRINASAERKIARAAVRYARELLQTGASAEHVAGRLGLGVEEVQLLAAKVRQMRAPQQKYARCQGCGGLVAMPCLLCQVRATKKRLET
jgi:hypothetical protein